MQKNRRHPRMSGVDSSVDGRSDIVDVAIAFACVVATAYLGFGFMAMTQNALWFVLGPLAGIIAGLACRRWLPAALAAGTGVAVGTLLGALSSPMGHGRLSLPSIYWLAIAVSVAVGAGVAALLAHRPDLSRWAAWLGVGFVLATLWFAGVTYATTSAIEGFAPVEFFNSTPTMSYQTYDEQIFVLAVRRMQQGQGYYSAMGRTLAELNAVRPGFSDDVSRPTAFRPPTLYWLLASLPGGGIGWVVAFLAIASAGTVAAWSIGARFVEPPLALVGTMVTAGYLARFAGINLVVTESWAGALAIVAVALAVKSLSVRGRAIGWACAAAAVALLATLTRELAVAFLVVGVASSLTDERVRSQRLWIPWSVGLGLAIVAYILHVQAVSAFVRTLASHPVAGPRNSYFDPTGRGLVAAVQALARYEWWAVPVAWLVWACGTVGGVVAPLDRPRRVLLGGVTVGAAVVLFCLHPAPGPGYPIPSYWSYVVMPSVIACSTLVFSRTPYLMREPRRR